MAVVPGTIVETGQAITVNLPTSRHPELPAIEDIADDDIFSIWDKSENKTKSVTADQIRAKINGAAVESPPVLSGADMEITIPPELDGQTRIDLPSLAGYSYSLERIGPSTSSRYLTSWFNNLSTGGWELTRGGDVFYEGETWIAHIFELEGGTTTIPGNTGGSGLIKGIKTLTTNYTIRDADMGYLLNSSAGTGEDAPKLIHTLDDVENITENSSVEITALVNNEYFTTIQTTNGQFIYINGEGKLKCHLGRGESIKLIRGDDGWYAVGAVMGYLIVGQPRFGYKQGLNDIIAGGQLLNRDEWPRLWEEVQTYGTSLLSDSDWLSGTSNARRGCWSTGDGSTNFRAPNLKGTSPRWLDLGRGFDVNPREYTMPGSYQPDAIGRFDKSNTNHRMLLQVDHHGTITAFDDDPDNTTQPNLLSSVSIDVFGSPENTVKNTGLLPLISG